MVCNGVLGECGDNCMNCESGVCKKCLQGYGKVREGCRRCDLPNCKHCDDDTESCAICSIYHYREEIKYKRGSFGCKKCSFGCIFCETQEKCLKCGRLFKFSERNRQTCVLNHRMIFFIISGIFCFLAIATAIGYHCTILTEEEEKQLKLKIELRSKKREEERRLMMMQDNHKSSGKD